MSFIHSSGFAYLKNLVIGVGAAVVLIGALFKIMSWEGAGLMLTIGLLTEAGLFVMLGLLPPHKEYYWEKLYPGLDVHGGPKLPGSGSSSFDGEALNTSLNKIGDSLGNITLDTTALEGQQKQMITELQTMAKSMSSLQALQEADFTEIDRLTKGAGNFATALNEAVSSISESLDDTKRYKEQLTQLNQNLEQLNDVYGGVLAAMGRG